VPSTLPSYVFEPLFFIYYFGTVQRRPGRFDTELEIGIPTSQDRSDILQKLLSKGKSPSPLSPRQVQDVADACHGYVGADLKALVNEAALLSIRRRHKTQQDADEQQQQHVAISFEDLQGALVHVRPSAMRQILIEVPTVTWADIGGQEEVKARLREAVEWPLKVTIANRQILSYLRITSTPRRSADSASDLPKGCCSTARPATPRQ